MINKSFGSLLLIQLLPCLLAFLPASISTSCCLSACMPAPSCVSLPSIVFLPAYLVVRLPDCLPTFQPLCLSDFSFCQIHYYCLIAVLSSFIFSSTCLNNRFSINISNLWLFVLYDFVCSCLSLCSIVKTSTFPFAFLFRFSLSLNLLPSLVVF